MEKMKTTLKGILYDMFYEDDYLSLTRVLAFMGYSLFALGSIYLLIFNIDWNGYSTFSQYTGGGGALTQVLNKFINSKYNTVAGGYDEATVEDRIRLNNSMFEEKK